MSKKLSGKAKQRARAKARAKQPMVNYVKTVPNSPIPGSGLFMLPHEVDKVTNMLKSDPPVENIRANKVDFDSLWDKGDAGFIMAVVPAHKMSNNQTNWAALKPNVQNVIKKFKNVRLNNNYMLLSAFCSADNGYKHFEELADSFACVWIAYSTPENLSTLLENVNLIRDWAADKPSEQFVKTLEAA
jgi:hypothetical protein